MATRRQAAKPDADTCMNVLRMFVLADNEKQAKGETAMYQKFLSAANASARTLVSAAEKEQAHAHD